MEVQSCVVSPHSDPRRLPNWPVILGGCSREASFILTPLRKRKKQGEDEEEEETPGEEEEDDEEKDVEEKEEEEDEEDQRTQSLSRRGTAGQPAVKKRSGRGVGAGLRTEGESRVGEEDGGEALTSYLRFSFVLRPVFNNSIHFLHCSLRQCGPDAHNQTPTGPAAERRCQGGVSIPALIKAKLSTQKVRSLQRNKQDQ